jgi:cation diffusion facilitator family transporter
MELQQQKTRVAWLSVFSNSVLVLLKLTVGLLIGSVSVLSEAIHSGVDLLAAVIALLAVRTSGKPADHDHPYGHGKFENISGTVEAVLIFVAAFWIIYEAIRKLTRPDPVESLGIGVAVMFVSVVLNIVVSQQLFRIGRRADSAALQADAWHLRTDVWTSAGVMAALAGMWVCRRVIPHANVHWLDPAAAIVVAVLIVRAAYQLTIESGRDLLDVSLPAEEREWIRARVCSLTPQVAGFHHLRTRKSGHMRFIDFHLLVDADMSVEESHALAENLAHELEARFPHSSVTVHVEPCNGNCSPSCPSGCLLSEEARDAVRCRWEASAGARQTSAEAAPSPPSP